MPQAQTMTLDEKLAVLNKSVALKKSGDLEGADRLVKSVPLPPFLAKIMKEKVGMEFFTRYNWNLSEVEAEFGPGFISK
ncbi:MAG: hypothetical protein LBN21_10530 [Treponema sp.]|jgi:hypothetical protein|nr:hypothetical protein [Treponema sp.]